MNTPETHHNPSEAPLAFIKRERGGALELEWNLSETPRPLRLSELLDTVAREFAGIDLDQIEISPDGYDHEILRIAGPRDK